MKKYVTLIVLCVAACSHNSNGPTTVNINANQVPTAVQSAFSAEHPYAQMDKPIQQTQTNHGAIYKIPFTRTDGSTGTATYTSFGELLKDE